MFILECTWEMLQVQNCENIEIKLPCRRGHTSEFTKDRLMIVFGGIKGFNKFTNDLIEINIQVSI